MKDIATTHFVTARPIQTRSELEKSRSILAVNFPGYNNKNRPATLSIIPNTNKNHFVKPVCGETSKAIAPIVTITNPIRRILDFFSANRLPSSLCFVGMINPGTFKTNRIMPRVRIK